MLPLVCVIPLPENLLQVQISSMRFLECACVMSTGYMSVCMYTGMHAHMTTHICGGHRLTTGVSLNQSSSYSLRQSLSIERGAYPCDQSG